VIEVCHGIGGDVQSLPPRCRVLDRGVHPSCECGCGINRLSARLECVVGLSWMFEAFRGSYLDCHMCSTVWQYGSHSIGGIRTGAARVEQAKRQFGEGQGSQIRWKLG
jgi:hypothetical protein